MESPKPVDNVDYSFPERRMMRLMEDLHREKTLDDLKRQDQPDLSPPDKIYDQLISCASFTTRRELQERQKAIDEFAHQFAVVDNTRREMIRREAERKLTNEVLENEGMKNGFDATIEQFDQIRPNTTPPDLNA